MKEILVCGAAGFIGNHLVKFLKTQGHHVIGIDLRTPTYGPSLADEFIIGDLKNPSVTNEIITKPFDEVYQLAADMGGAGYLFTGERDADIMYNALMINLNVLKRSAEVGVKKIFYPSSACIYPKTEILETTPVQLKESDAYPASPGSEYGWEKLFSERLYESYRRNYGITAKIARFHTVFGPGMDYDGGREKAPAALARKVIQAEDHTEVEVWGDGKQTRSFLYIDECMEAIQRLMDSDDFHGPVNIGADEEISINDLTRIFIDFSDKNLKLKHIPGLQGTRSRNSDNQLIFEKLNWKPSAPTRDGLRKLYDWIDTQIQ